jgi:uncharacterized protein
MSGTVSPSLSEAEIERLKALLAANRNPDALSLEAVDGLFCALIASPALVMPHEYLPVILGGTLEGGGLLGDLAAVQEMMGLLVRLWNAIAQDFERETIHVAHRDEPGEDGVPGRAWARGYMHGIRLAPAGWSRILQDDNEQLVRFIPIVAGEADPAWPKEPLTEEKANAMLTDIFAGAARAYRYFKEDRLEYAQAAARRAPPEPYERAAPKVGRNDPCPCGSGKKYKRCCGAPEAGDRVVH